jgi:5-deoxy-D-glucuronate isomerase
MDCLVEKPFQRGMNELYGLPDRRLKRLSAGVARLEAGDRFGETLNAREAVLIFLWGSARVRGDNFDFGEVSGRESPFEGRPTAIYCPPGLFGAKAMSECGILVLRRECAKEYKGTPRLIESGEVVCNGEPGTDEMARCRIWTPGEEGSSLVVGETHYCPGAAPAALWETSDPHAGEAEAAAFLCVRPAEEKIGVEVAAAERSISESLDAADGGLILSPAGSMPVIDPRQSRTVAIWVRGASE